MAVGGPSEDPEHEAAAGRDEQSAGAADRDAAAENTAGEGVAGGSAAAGGEADQSLRAPAGDGSGGRSRRWRIAAIVLGSAAGVAGIAVLSVFIYSIFDRDDWFDSDAAIFADGTDSGWFGYAPLSPDEDRRSGHDGGCFADTDGVCFGDAPLSPDEDRRLGRDGGRGDGRDRPVAVPRHDEAAGRARDDGRADSRAGHPHGAVGDKADGYEGAPAVAASKGCVEVKDLGRRVLLMCDREYAGGKGVEGWWKGYEERPGREGLGGGRFPGWGAEPGARWRGPPWWPPEGGLSSPGNSFGGFPSGDFYGLAPEVCREIPLRGTSLEGGTASRVECVTPSSAFCMGLGHLRDDVLRRIECVTPLAAFCTEGEVYGPRGFAFAECSGFAGDFPPDWPGLGRASPGGRIPFSPDDSPGDDNYASVEDFPFRSEDGYSEGEAEFVEGWPAPPEESFGVPGWNVGFDFEALVELLPYVLESEMFEEILGVILGGLLDTFEGLPFEGVPFEGRPEGGEDFDFDSGARDESNLGELLEGLDDEFLGLILGSLLAGLEGSPGAEVDLDLGGFGDTTSEVPSEDWLEELEDWLEELFGSLFENLDIEA